MRGDHAPDTAAAEAEANPRPDWLPRPGMRLAAARSGIFDIPQLPAFFEASTVVPLPDSRRRLTPGMGRSAGADTGIDGAIGWGLKPSAERARRYAQEHDKPFWRVEDGFLRSVGLGKSGAPPVSLVVDDLGIYYDARTASRLETILATQDLSPLRDRAAALRELIVQTRLSKYNHLPDRPLKLPRTGKRRILLVDQVAGDLSLEGGLATAETFRDMAQAARSQHPHAELLVRVHPDVRAGLASSSLLELQRHFGLLILGEDVAAHALLDVVDEVWTVSSQLGFDALLYGLPVTCFGVPFYAGWGLTDDRATGTDAHTALKRRSVLRRSTDELVAAALLLYPRYADPIHRTPQTAENAIARLEFWRRCSERNAGKVLCSRFSRWKRPIAQAFLGGPRSHLRFSDRQPGGRTSVDHHYVWGMKRCSNRSQSIHRVEDGFIRSIGLGSDFRFPYSLCVDATGIYYDATKPSDLETLLAAADFTSAQTARAQKLIKELVKSGISKYNLDAQAKIELPALAPDRTIILVPGQVPDDASLRYGLCTVEDNLALLSAVRRERPDAYIIYKEHPELVSGNRKGAYPHETYRTYADLVVSTGSVVQWIKHCHEVHVMTSLAGFEALLRGKRVTCWGLPFYAGWGLTSDRVDCDRRGRRLSVEELVAGCLIQYPRYVDADSRLPCTPEDVLQLIQERSRTQAPASHRTHAHRFWHYLRQSGPSRLGRPSAKVQSAWKK